VIATHAEAKAAIRVSAVIGAERSKENCPAKMRNLFSASGFAVIEKRRLTYSRDR
jgi:hypothetical protein